ncbi:MAG TPA: antitoxin Xre/MbcA/ParS toxin-binding domain-containing protein [Burkholderiales bacterium]|nr:antitoxin Xre/MbcA/ParS toxin-binding domain-containing protein [Burkholderiales bacterium]
MKAYRATLAALRTTVAERRAGYRPRARASTAPPPSTGPLIDLDARTVPFAALKTLAERIGVTLEEILAVAAISARTAARRKTERFLKPEEADRVLRIARVVEESARVFGGYEKAAAWLRARHPLLAGAAPFALLGSDAGAKSVSDELIRIDHGDFA